LAFLATKIICVSNGVKRKRFKRFGSWAARKIIVIYNGVDTKKFTKKNSDRKYIREKLGVDQDITLFGIIGSIIPIKGHDFFLRGFVRAKLKNPDLHLQLLIIGRKLDTSYFRKITKFILENNLNENVIIKNYSQNIREIFSAIDTLALPSQREGFSRSMLEAMSCGLPILATKISEVEEAIIDNKNGILVEYMDIEKMASAIIKLCNSKSMRNEIGTRNRLIVDRKFNLISHAKAIGSLYFSIIRNDAHTPCRKKLINFRTK
jgi:glycosyltransferase involved in cell wall biosynthesis